MKPWGARIRADSRIPFVYTRCHHHKIRMYFKQFYLSCLSQASYFIADEETRTAVIVDPRRDIDQYLAEAAEHGFVIRHVFLTHFHADFLAGHIELRERTGATIHLSARATAEFEFTPAREGEPLEFGTVRLEFLDTPGHTNEAVSIVIYDLERDSREPYGILTGDTLFVGDVGRPDLLASVGSTASELGGMLYDSLHDKILKLPDETLVYPAHGSGSLCGKSLGKENHSTIGAQRKQNYALQPMSREDFIDLVSADQPTAPPYFLHDAVLNRSEHATLDDVLLRDLNALPLEQVLKMQAVGAQVLDAREVVEFGAGHLAGSLNIPLTGRFATWCGFLLNPDHPILLITNAGQEVEAAVRLGRIGYDFVSGFLEGGAATLAEQDSATLARLSLDDLSSAMEKDSPQVLDVRTVSEWEVDHVEGSVNIPLQELSNRLDELDSKSSIRIVCKSSARSAIAASLMLARGFTDVTDVIGGMDAWRTAGKPLVQSTTI